MRKILAPILTLLMIITLLCTSGCFGTNDTPRQNQATDLPKNATIPQKAKDDQAAEIKFTTAGDGSDLKSISDIDNKIDDNKNLIGLLQKANVILAQKKIDVQVAIDQTWGYLLAGFFSLGALIVGIYTVLWAVPGTKILFTKISIALGLLAVLILTLVIYLPTVFIIAKYIALTFIAGLIVGAFYFIHALIKEGVAGNLSEEMEKLPFVGHLFMEANKVAAVASTDIKNVNVKVEAAIPEVSKIEATIKTDANVAVVDATKLASQGVAKVEAIVKKS